MVKHVKKWRIVGLSNVSQSFTIRVILTGYVIFNLHLNVSFKNNLHLNVKKVVFEF